jgi:lysophospholipase L1-like esterase
MKKSLVNGLIVLGVTVCLLLLIEGAIRVFWNQRHQMKFITHQAAVNMDSAKFTFRLKPNMQFTETNPEFSVTYSTNAEGFRDQSIYLNKEKDTAKIRILALGDSFTFGVGSEYEDTWLAKLEKELKIHGKSIEIIKAGVPAYNQFLEYYLMVDVIGLYKPDYVFVGFLPNDLFENKPLDEVSAPTNLMPATEAGGDRKIRQAARAWRTDYQTFELVKRLMLRIDEIYIRIYERTDRIEFFKHIDHLEPKAKRQYEVTAELFRGIKLVCDANKAGLVVISIPQQYQVLKNDQSKDVDIYSIDKYFSKKASESGYVWITSLPEFKEQAKNQAQYYRVDGHLTPFGNTVLANAVIKQFPASGSGL